MEKHTWNVGFVLFLLREEAQVSLTWIASLAIRVRSLSDPTAKNKALMIGWNEESGLAGAWEARQGLE
ncbi:hypothetical protein Tco_1258196, partial [Tanacetum coccineum]